MSSSSLLVESETETERTEGSEVSEVVALYLTQTPVLFTLIETPVTNLPANSKHFAQDPNWFSLCITLIKIQLHRVENEASA